MADDAAFVDFLCCGFGGLLGVFVNALGDLAMTLFVRSQLCRRVHRQPDRHMHLGRDGDRVNFDSHLDAVFRVFPINRPKLAIDRALEITIGKCVLSFTQRRHVLGRVGGIEGAGLKNRRLLDNLDRSEGGARKKPDRAQDERDHGSSADVHEATDKYILASTMARKTQTPPKNFEDALRELEQILSDMEGGQVGLEESLVKYERGSFLIQHCRTVLSSAEKQIEILNKTPDGFLTSQPALEPQVED